MWLKSRKNVTLFLRMETTEILVPRGGVEQLPSCVVIGDALGRLEAMLDGRRPILITDPNLKAAYPELVGRYPHVVMGLGETHKTLDTVAEIYRELLRLGADRGSYLVGVGGGIVTDVTGFVASTYMRGVSGFGFVATSLLAQVDASVGGKNGVNLDGYKNIVGVFHQPDFVLCDQGMLSTLPERELRAGLAEVIKCGLIRDRALFEAFENHTFETFVSNADLLHRAIVASVELKAAVVAADETERGERKLLNLGHTLAHAVEKCTGHYLHGEAVGIGLCVSAVVSHKLGLLSAEDAQRVVSVVKAMGLPAGVAPETGVTRRKLMDALGADKKREADTIDFVVMEGIGAARRQRMTLAELDTLLEGVC